MGPSSMKHQISFDGHFKGSIHKLRNVRKLKARQRKWTKNRGKMRRNTSKESKVSPEVF